MWSCGPPDVGPSACAAAPRGAAYAGSLGCTIFLGRHLLKLYPEFEEYATGVATGDSYEERIGEPDTVAAGLGHVALGFSHLEDVLNAGIWALLRVGPHAGSIVTSEIAYKAKIHILASLVRHHATSHLFNHRGNTPVEDIDELVPLLFRAEELRNQVMHSSWLQGGPAPGDLDTPRRTITRLKASAKAGRGYRIHSEVLSGDYLLDIYDYTLNVAWAIDEFFLHDDLQKAIEKLHESGAA